MHPVARAFSHMPTENLTWQGSVFQLDMPLTKNIIKNLKITFPLKYRPGFAPSKARGSFGTDFAGVTVRRVQGKVAGGYFEIRLPL